VLRADEPHGGYRLRYRHSTNGNQYWLEPV
jgi:hypothetical protein